jgi:2-dehydropantoate 2-reductase
VLGIDPGRYPARTLGSARLPQSALVLVAVKAYDLATALRELAPRLDASHVVVVLQNGLGVRTLAERILGRPVIRGVTFLAAARVGPGVVAFNAVGKTYFPAGSEGVMGLWRSGGLPAVVVPNLLTYVWRKLAINAVINPLSALLSVPNGELVALRWTARQLVEETTAVAQRVGQPLDPQETLAKVRASMRQTAGNTSSMLQDVRAGHRTEIDWINGAIVRLADRCGIEAPLNRQLVEMVRLLERRAPGKRPA